jgi:hydroxymethylglutaryl-CoA synthase
MISVATASTYIPRYRLSREVIAQAWGGRAAPGYKAVTNFDEDALTMAVAAVHCLGPQTAERLYFASTSSPYWQRSAASQIAAACDWDTETATADFGGSLRSGFSALIAAADAIGANRAADIIVTAADHRDGTPESPEELLFGDAAAAIRLTSQPGAAEIVAYTSRSDDFLDEWRRDADNFVHNYASKYSLTRGFEANVVAAAKAVLAKADVQPSEIAVFAVNSPDGRSHLGCAKALGIAADRVRDGAAQEIGVTGVAMPLIALAQALASAKADDLVLGVAYGDGAEAILFRSTAPIDPPALDDKAAIPYASYSRYRKSREHMRQEERGPEISNVLWKKEEHQNVRLHGTKCPKCGMVQFPITRVCTACRNSEGLMEIPLGRTGRVFTFTKDYLYDAPVMPTMMSVVDLDGGGRFLCQMTDVDERDVRIGMPVELVLRRLREGGQNHHYYWKCRPSANDTRVD